MVTHQLQKGLELLRRPYLAKLAAGTTRTLRPLGRIGREHLVHDHGIPECLTQNCVDVLHRPRRQARAIPAARRRKIAVKPRKPSWPDSLKS